MLNFPCGIIESFLYWLPSKNLPVLAALAMIFTTLNVSAEGEDEDRRRRKGGDFGIHLNLSPIAFRTYSLNAEYGFNKNTSAVLTLGFVDLSITQTSAFNGGIPTINVVPFRGFIAVPEYRYYFAPNRRPGLDRWFVGGYLKVRSIATNSDQLVAPTFNILNPGGGALTTYDVNYFGLSAGATFGYVYAMKSGLTFSSWLGLGYFLISNETYTNDVSLVGNIGGLLAVDGRFGLTVGYRF